MDPATPWRNRDRLERVFNRPRCVACSHGLDRRRHFSFQIGQLLCKVIATLVSSKHPKVATIERMVKNRPKGTVYVDYLQNILGKSIQAAYSARASDYAGVSTPLTWAEVAEGVDPHDFTIRTAPTRFRDVGDLWEPIRTGKAVDLKAIIK